MAIGVVGRKAGMTRIFTDEGQALPVTVIEVEPNRITQLKTLESDGYRAVQVTVGSRRSSRVNKAAAGHFAKAGVEAGRGVWEFRLAGGEDEIQPAGRDRSHGVAGGVWRLCGWWSLPRQRRLAGDFSGKKKDKSGKNIQPRFSVWRSD